MPNSRSTHIRLFCVAAIVIVAALCVLFAYSLFPLLIARAYRGESLSVLNRLITNQAHRPVADYLAHWSRFANHMSAGLVVLGACILIAVVGLTRKVALPPSESADKIAMSRPRLVVVYALGAVILGGALSELVRDTEHWPFSPYPMYSELSPSKTLSVPRLYGVVQTSPLIEIQLDNGLYIQPFDNSRLADALEHARQKDKLQEAVADCLTRYEVLRRAGRHDGPPLVAMRLYEVTWTLDPSPSDLNQPDHKELLTEVTARREGGD
jgi:hypothetical protein